MKKISLIVALLLVVGLMITGCGDKGGEVEATPATPEAPATEETPAVTESDGDMTIGIAINDLQLERWQRDWSYMEAACKANGVKYISASADGDDQKQLQQVESMLTQGIDVLIIIATSSESMASAVKLAHESDVPVICYDRLISNADVDYYITFDMIGVGREQAKFLLNIVPKGRYFMLEGDQTDNNAHLFYTGQMEIMQPIFDAGDVELVATQWAEGWAEESALNVTENTLTAANNKIDAILCANDSTAGGAVKALEGQGLAGKIPITGQDCDLAACKGIVAGTQSMSVYKRLESLATAAVELAIQVVNGETINANDSYNNGFKDVPTVALELIIVTKDNMVDKIIKDGFHSYDDVYADVPEDQRPPKP